MHECRPETLMNSCDDGEEYYHRPWGPEGNLKCLLSSTEKEKETCIMVKEESLVCVFIITKIE